MNKLLFFNALFLLIFNSCLSDFSNNAKMIDDKVLENANAYNHNWLTYGKNYSEDRYNDENQINLENIENLGLEWHLNLETKRGIEATPIVVDGIMYITGPWSIVYSINAKNGDLIWKYDPKVPKHYGEKACCDVVNRGVAYYKGAVIFGSLDGRLISLDAKSGKVNWEVDTIVDKDLNYTITGAPRVFDGKVFIGNGGAEYGGIRGYFSAFDALSGKLAWRFFTVPGDPELPFEHEELEKASKTWTGEWWKLGGGGTVWDSFVYDPELKLVYVGTGNGSPWNREIRSPKGGDNLFLSSILAINVESGKLKWHYQTTPGETWDYTAVQQIILSDLYINGKNRKVLMQAPKNGFFYVLDRITGELISADPYVYVNWAKKVDLDTGRPIETKGSRYKDKNKQIFPSPVGGHNWQPMSYNNNTGLVYIPARENSMFFGENTSYVMEKNQWSTGVATDNGRENIVDNGKIKKSHGKLIAWDPISKSEKWSYIHKSPWNSGVLSLKDIVFQGDAEGVFRAFNAENGEVVWEKNLLSGIVAPPISYYIDNEQYITIPVGWGGVLGLWTKYTDQIYPGTLYTFKLNSNNAMPNYPKKEKPQRIALDVSLPAKNISHGESLYGKYCVMCHQLGNGGGSIPDLTYSKESIFNMMKEIVIDGVFLEKGMPSFKNRLSENDLNDIKSYILDFSNKLN